MGARAPNYLQATANTRVVAAKVAELIMLMKESGLNLANVHLVGHSLGAQISGKVGKFVKQASNDADILGRISGKMFTPPTKSWRGYIFASVCLFVCVCV